jgi:hypothetical protein
VHEEIVTVEPQIAAFRRMVRQLEFDVCELAPTTCIIARAYGYPFVALPIFVLRRFHHAGLLVRPDAGIKTPKDLEGRKVGRDRVGRELSRLAGMARERAALSRSSNCVAQVICAAGDAAPRAGGAREPS